MLFIGICGASGSGKTTLARELARELGGDCVLLNQDAYYLDHPDLPFEERVVLNYDEPSIFDHDLLYQDVCALLAGRPITQKAYDYADHRRKDTGGIIAPANVLILEGIHTFYDKRLTDKMSLRLYTQTDPDLCLLRRIRRDIKTRGRQIDDISAQYLATVKPMYERYIRNYVHDADIIVPENTRNDRVVPILIGYLRSELQKQRTE